MPKTKTNKVFMRRFKITKTGKVMRYHLGARHRRTHKDKRRVRRFGEPIQLNPLQTKAIKKILGR